MEPGTVLASSFAQAISASQNLLSQWAACPAASQHFHLAHVGSGSCVTRIAGPNGGTYRTIDEGRSFEAGSQVLISSHRKLLSSVRWPIACAMQHGLLLWVKSPHYRAAALVSASPGP